MNQIEWHDRFSIGVEKIDMDHKILLNLLNQFNETIACDILNDNEARTVLGILIDYIDSHFAEEESLMISMNYPQADSHILAHQAIRDDIATLTSRIDESKDTNTYRELAQLLNNWWRVHILGIDQEYHSFIYQNSGQQPQEPLRARG